MAEQWTVSDPRFDKPAQRDEQQRVYEQIDLPPKPPRSRFASCLIGCLVVAGVLLALFIAVAFWIGFHLRGWVADIGSQAVEIAIDSSDLPAQEKVEVKEQVARVATAFENKQITVEQAGQIFEKLTKSPLMPSLVVVTVEKRYFDPSGLSDEEKAQGRQSLQRFARGVFDGKIKDDGIDAVMEHVSDRRAEGEWRLRRRVSDQDLRAALAEAKARADKAGIGESPGKVDPSDEIKRIVDESFAQQQAEDSQ